MLFHGLFKHGDVLVIDFEGVCLAYHSHVAVHAVFSAVWVLGVDKVSLFAHVIGQEFCLHTHGAAGGLLKASSQSLSSPSLVHMMCCYLGVCQSAFDAFERGAVSSTNAAKQSLRFYVKADRNADDQQCADD